MAAKNPGFDREGKFQLEVPLDASRIQDFTPDRGLKVVVLGAGGETKEQVVKFEKGGAARAVFSFAERPARLRVVVGPETATAEQLQGLQTLSAEVTGRQWGDKAQFSLAPILISNYYWRWWWRWCRRYKITGRVVCANGNVVAGAQVCAYDVDYWWWWWSKDLVGCATTDANGAFEIDFTSCCGWWPWWWWRRRLWLLNPDLVDRIHGVLRQDLRLTKIPIPDPHPDPEIFRTLLRTHSGVRTPVRQLQLPAKLTKSRGLAGADFDPATLDGIRTDLLKVLPPAQEFERLRLWPWYPWYPWWDCDADLIFRVTQNCNGTEKVIVNETIWDTHWDVPTDFNVTLSANDQACCVAPPCGEDCPSGECLLPSDICLDNIGSIGGNEGATAASPVGLLYPAQGTTLSYAADRPYAGSVPLFGQFGDLAQVDYYELLVYYAGNGTPSSPDPVLPATPLDISATTFTPVPIPTYGGFDRAHLIFDPLPHWPSVPFHVQPISDGATDHNVIETIEHYEANNGSQLWDSASFYLLGYLNTAGNLPNGTYYLQLRGWKRPGPTGNLTNPQILPICGTQNDPNPMPNYWAVTIDNQLVTGGPTDVNGLACGPGTVHVCTGQPESQIRQVQIQHQDGSFTQVGACANVCVVDTDNLVIDFVAYDPDGYLGYYTLDVVYGDSLLINLLGLAGATLAASPAPAPYAPATSQYGPDYGSALQAPQNASAPWWVGGSIRLTVPANLAFPETCAYDVQLYVHKRTISGCDHGFWNQYNASGWSFTIVNPCPASAVG
jgi:hypothetical protein